jgi:hypothetical protein
MGNARAITAINLFNTELNTIFHLLALLEALTIFSTLAG